MAGTLLHTTLADGAARKIDDGAGILNNHDDFRLGAVLVDLPYYDKLWLTGLKMLMKQPLSFNPWGTLVHLRSPSGLCLALLDRAKTPGRRAVALGALTHQAVDLVFHPEIAKRVLADADGTTDLDTVHKHIEDQMDLHCHYHLLSHSGMGTPYCRRSLWLRPSAGWEDMVRSAFLKIHGSAPAAGKLRSWLRNLALFGVGSSTGLAPWVKTLPADDPRLLELSVELADRAISLCVEYIQAGIAYMNGEIDSEVFMEKVPDLSMIDGTPAKPAVNRF